MESLPLTAMPLRDVAPPGAALPAPETVPEGDPEALGAFVAALLQQAGLAQPVAPETGGGAASAVPGLPPTGQVLAASAASAAPATPAGVRPLLLAAAGHGRDSGGTPVTPDEQALLPREVSAASAAAGDVDAEQILDEVLRGDASRATPATAAASTPVLETARAALAAADPGTPLPAATATSAAADAGADALSALGARATDLAATGETYHGRSVTLPVADPEVLAERLNQQVAIMVGQNAQHARIAVNPPELGPVEVRVSVVGDEATIQLAATHGATREALEEALPRLRAAFAEGGLTLADAGVFAQMPERRAGGDAPSHDGALAGPADGTAPDAGDPAPLRRVRIGLVDAFV